LVIYYTGDIAKIKFGSKEEFLVEN